MAERKVIANADDFGRSPTINAAVMRAHRQGILTSASVMATGPAAAEAIALASDTPNLAVGLHLTLVSGRALLPHSEIPQLVDSQGYFKGSPLTLGLRCAFSPRLREEIRREMAAQFERFCASGLPLSHVDSHLHLHMHPLLFDMLLEMARTYGASGLRIPRDDLVASLRFHGQSAATKCSWALIFGLLAVWARRRLRQSDLVVADRVYGLMQSGRMSEGYLLALLPRMTAPVTELYFHPDLAPVGQPLGPNPGDLAALLSPAVRAALAREQIRLTTYLELARARRLPNREQMA